MNAHDIAMNLAACNTLSELYTARKLAREWKAEWSSRSVGQLGLVHTPLSSEDAIKEHRRLFTIASDAYFGRTGDGPKHSANGPYLVSAIKAIREATGWGLKEAKDWCYKYLAEFA